MKRMINFLKSSVSIFLLLLVVSKNSSAQSCIIPSINAQAGTGPTTVVCAGQCANLTATMVAPPRSTTTYSVGSVTYSTMPYFGGNNVFATSSDDLWSDSISIGFNFCYFGNTYNKLLVGSNGEITFDLSKANGFESWVTTAVLPNTIEHPGNTICGAYRDYDPFPGGVVRTYTTGVAPCRQFVAYWSGVTLFSCATPVSSFQIVLYEGSNNIAVNIQNSTACMSWNNGRGLIGIQNQLASVVVAPPTRNTLTAWTAINESWLFVPTAAPSFSVNWSGPGGFTATGLTATPCPTASGTYSATLSYCNGSRTSTVQVNVSSPTINVSASSNTVCPPGSVTLTATGATTYTWMPGSLTGSAVVVSPTVNTTYTVIGSAGTCTSSATIPITVGTPPTVNAFNLTGTICPGGTANCIATGALSYTWNPGGIIGNIVALSPTVSTIYTVTGTAGGCPGTATLLVPVGSSPTITALSSPTSICAGSSATLTASGATSYTWNPGALTGSSVVVNPAVTTTYTITGTSTLTCPGTKTITLVVNTTPTLTAVSNPTSICVGGSATLTSTGATSYTWMPGSLSGGTVTVSPASTTVYTVTGSNGTCSSTRTVQTTVNTIPTVTAAISNATVCAGTSVTLTAGGATTYTWNPGSLTGVTVVTTPTANTTYTVIGSNGTCTNSANVSVTVNPTPTLTAVANPTAICSGAGTTVTLTSSGASSYTWMPGSLSGGTVTVTPTITTTYTVTGASAAGCTNTRTVTLTVNTTPTITASASSATVCSGSTVSLSSSGATTYTWMPGSLSGGTVTVTPTITTTYTVTGANGSCTNTRTVSVTVNPSPTVTAVASPTSICSGSSATLTGSGATSYTWMPGSLTGATVAVSPTITTTYTLTGSNGTCSNTRTVTLTVNATPTLTAVANPTAICTGATATLTSSGATSYTWMPGSLTGATVTVSPVSTTVYTVTGANGSCTNTRTVSLTINPSPTINAVANPTVICSGSSATLTGSGATSYTWMPGSLSGATVSVSPATTTNYTLTGSNGTCSRTVAVSVSVTPLPTLTAVANPTAICVGSSATLTSSGATSYTWNPGALTGASISVSPTITTVYTVTGNNGTCSNTRTVSLTVNPNPTVTASVSSPSICSGTSATLTSSGATTYTWMPGSLSGGTVVVSPTVTTTYTVTGANAAGCRNTNTVTLNVTPGPTLSAIASPTSICSGSSSTLTGSGATTYTWMPGSITTATTVVTPTTTTNYTLTGNNGTCSSTIAVTVSVTPLPTLTAVSNPTAICSGASATLTSSGATTYTWMPGSLSGGTVVVSPTITTNYTVTGANGSCTNTQTVSLTVNTSPTVTASMIPASGTICAGRAATLTANGAFTYTWIPGSMTSPTVVVAPPVTTTYTLTGTNASGCSSTTTILVTVIPGPTITVSASSNSICSGASATLTASGAVSSYSWNPGLIIGNPIVVTPSITTTYTVRGTNASGCLGGSTFTLSVIPTPTITASTSAGTICAGNTVTLSSSGASTYTWNPGALSGGTVTASPTVTTTYTVIGDNGGGCTDTANVLVTVNPSPTLTAVSSPTAICSGSSATLTGTGATSYTWMPGSLSGATVTVTPSITTTYTLTGSNGTCSSTVAVTLTVTTTPTITASSTPTGICFGGTATLTSSGATSYTWMPGSLTGGTVTVTPTVSTVYTVTGANGACTDTKTVSLNVSPSPTVTASANPPSICAGATSTLSASGATSYTWSPAIPLTGVVSPTVTTTYTVIGANAAGCTNSTVVTVTVFSAPSITAITSKTAICLGDTATLSATGAITYTWNPGALIGTPVVVNPTVTTIYTVTGSNGICTSNATVSILVNTYPTVTAVSNPTALCAGNSATLTGSGATTYTWMPGSLTGSSVVVNPTVTTTYSVTGANGSCTGTQTLNLTVNPNPTVTASSTPTTPICAGNAYTLTASGATTYTWMPGSLSGATVIVTPTTNTTYTVTGANATGCSSTRTINVNVIPGPTLTAVANPTSICTGQTATLTTSGALTYTWMPIAVTGSTVFVSPTVTTTYTVTGINAGGCTSTKTVSLVVNTTPTITANTSATVLCSGSSATLTSSGATTYTWNPGALSGGTVVVTPTVNTTYTVVGANGNCTNTKTVSITVNPSPTVTSTASPTIICGGSTTTLTATGATSYTWMPPAITGATVVVSPTVITVYTVTGVNAFGCTKTSTVLVNVNTPTITTIASPTSICIGSSATITASGATSYTWMPGASTGTNIVVNPTVTTTYTVTGLSPFGCTGTKTITLNVLPLPTVTAVSSSTAVCAGSSATLTGAGASTYTWMPGSLTGTSVIVTPTATTVYTVTGNNGSCSSTNTISLQVNPNPTVSAVSNPTIVCSGATTTLTASGALTYSWSPIGVVANPIAVTVTATTVYTVIGTDALGCSNTSTVLLTLGDPTVTASSTPTAICVVGSVTLNANGASTYTWSPGAATGSSVVVNPTVTTTYSVTGTNTLGCIDTETVMITVFTNPTVTAAASPTTICSGLSTTLTSAGAMTYTWIPGSMPGATVVVTPTTTTTYSVIGVNGVCAADTATITVNVLQSPQNVTATNSGTITCLTPTVDLFGSTTSTNVTYQWSGPSSFTSSVQNPTGITVGGVYTLSVTDAVNGCITTATTAVITNTAGPTVSLTSTGTITCLNNTVSIAVSSTVASVSYTWNGPSSFTSTATGFTTSTGGVYTVSAFDPATGCTSTNTVAAITDTYVAVTATIIPATCTGSVSNNNGTIIVGNFINPTDKYDLVAGASYTGTASYATATVIPVTGTITSTLANPTANTPYTIRFFGVNGCIKDTTLVLVPVDCAVNNALGLAKAITAVTTNTNGTYGVTYKVVVKNTGFASLSNVVLTENLSNTFPLPTTFTVSSAPVIITPVTSLTLDATFNGSTQSALTTTQSALAINETDTIVFTVDVLPNGVFGTFNNTVLGAAVGGTASTAVADSSQVGLNTDPDSDGNPTNNNVPTPLNLTPNQFFGVTKEGFLSEQLADGSFDITYTVSIHNLGNDTLRNIILKDSLAGKTIKSPASYTMKSGPTASGLLVANSSYNGNSDPNLTIPATSKIGPNSVYNVIFTINVFPDTVTVVRNSATGSAVGTGSVTVRDTSNNGNNPDTNNNGIWNETADNVPTVLIIPDNTFLVPEAFTPNDDGKNDFFVIKGINGTENTLTVYNRWGNKVYKMDNYDNTWNGTPNVSGTLGNQKLPQGTYYYILEFKGEQKKGKTELKTTNGFVVLQY